MRERDTPALRRFSVVDRASETRDPADAGPRTNDAWYRDLFEHASDIVYALDCNGCILVVNRAAERLTGYTPDELRGRNVLDFLRSEDRGRIRRMLERTLNGRPCDAGEITVLGKHGRIVVLEVGAHLGQDCDGSRIIQGIAHDISRRKTLEEQLQDQALHDTLTRLPNRALFRDRLQQAIDRARREKTPVAMLLMDLDRFKEVNDTFGHQAGDELLREVAARLRTALRTSDTVARLGGDEFALVLPRTDAGGASTVAAALRQVLREPFAVERHRLDIDGSIGIAVFPGQGSDVTTLLRHADVAMYSAKHSGIGHCVYAPEQDPNTPARLSLISDLRTCVERNELLLHYQPIVSMRTGRADYVEALVRWRHPELGNISPGEFIPLAEETGLMDPITLWVLAAALRDCAAWQNQGVDLGVAVNLSARTLYNLHLPDTIARLLKTSAVHPAALTVEITETSLMSEPEQAKSVLEQLHAMGVRIAIDDFGVGYSSLAYLQHLPVDEIKVDRSFVLGLEGNGDVIVRAIIDLGYNLGIEVTGEGVEDQETWDKLVRMGCSKAQGFYICRPVAPSGIVEWFRSFDRREERRVPGKVILVVDDSPVYLKIVRELLGSQGYHVITATTAEEALKKLETTTPDLILADVWLPGLNGLDLVPRMRANPRLRRTPIVAITGYPSPEDEAYALNTGCSAYASKPSNAREIIYLVRQHLAA